MRSPSCSTFSPCCSRTRRTRAATRMFPHRLGDEEYTVPHHESPPRDSRYFDAQPALAQQQPLPIPVPWHYNNQASHQIPPFHRSHSYPSPVHPPPPIHSITDFAVESSLFSHSAGWQPAPLPPPQPLPLSSSVPSYSAASYTPFTPYSAPEQPPWPPSSSSSFTTTPYAARPSSTPSSNEAQPRTHIDHESVRASRAILTLWSSADPSRIVVAPAFRVVPRSQLHQTFHSQAIASVV